MNFDDACRACEEGRAIRHPGMSPRWTIQCIPTPSPPRDPRYKHNLYCINPHTGSNYAFMPTEAEMARNDWSAG